MLLYFKFSFSKKKKYDCLLLKVTSKVLKKFLHNIEYLFKLKLSETHLQISWLCSPIFHMLWCMTSIFLKCSLVSPQVIFYMLRYCFSKSYYTKHKILIYFKNIYFPFIKFTLILVILHFNILWLLISYSSSARFVRHILNFFCGTKAITNLFWDMTSMVLHSIDWKNLLSFQLFLYSMCY